MNNFVFFFFKKISENSFLMHGQTKFDKLPKVLNLTVIVFTSFFGIIKLKTLSWPLIKNYGPLDLNI